MSATLILASTTSYEAAPTILYVILLVSGGLIIGSFLNVCIYRLPRSQSLITPQSHCTACGHHLKWFENVPVIGYTLLGGRCRMCGESISAIYPLVEVITSALFLLSYWQIGWQPLLLSRLIFMGAMVVLFVIDWQHRILPNEITLPGAVVGIVFSMFLPPVWFDSVVGVVGGWTLLLLIRRVYYLVRGEEGLGVGDVKMLAMIGAFLGFDLMLLTLFLASFIGSLVGISLMITKKGDIRDALPFGTFLAVGGVTSGLIGESVLGWYWSFYF